MAKTRARTPKNASDREDPPIYGLPIPAALVDLVLLGPTEDRRQLQDSPILGDVWMEYAANAAGVQDLLVTPHKKSTAADVASAIVERLDKERSLSSSAHRHTHDVAFLQGLVATQLDLVEMLQVIVPMTHWWSERHIAKTLGGYTPEKFKQKLEKVFDSIQATGTSNYGEIAPLDRFLALAGLLLWAQASNNIANIPRNPKPVTKLLTMVLHDLETVRDELVKVYGGIKPKRESSSDDIIFSVSLNRRVSTAIARSVPSVKGDAARSLFKVNASKIAWAVLDSGIEWDHPAFRLEAADKAANGKAAAGQKRNSRVEKTYDFTQMRKLVSISGDLKRDAAEIAESLEKPRASVEQALKYLRESARRDGKINWKIAEGLLELDNPPAPVSAHGTHVAGIIGACKPPNRSDLADGMCPDIRLYDFRVLAKTIKDTEFAVIAALQFIRYINDKHSYVTIHGANLSLSIPHNVRNYACGRTPVCNECQRLIESGVVVVAAAGNRGYQRFETKDGLFENYTAFSVTDPGNADDVITVGATHGNWPHTYGVSFFSSRGPTGDGRPKPDLVAPGEKISAPVLNGGVGAESGTSMAAPHVSGAAAMLMARYPELVGNPRRIKRILCDSATNLERERSFQGAGMLDVLRAFQSI
jgi:serine protease AprX